MKEYSPEDSFGRRTVFVGQRLIDDHTDTEDASKPQWLEVEVWKTEGGNYVVRKSTCYRVCHASERCTKAEGYTLVPATPKDTVACKRCNSHRADEGWAQADRVTVDVYPTPRELIDSFERNGAFSYFARSLLAQLAELDGPIRDAWNVVRVS